MPVCCGAVADTGTSDKTISKSAASEPVLSFKFVVLYGGMLFILFAYAIGWQQIIKRIPLTLAFANKAITVVWGMVWGVIFFGESISVLSVIGAVFVVAGVILFALADEDPGSHPIDEGAAAGVDA